MARTSQQFRWNWVYQFFRQVSWRFYRWTSAVFLACLRASVKVLASVKAFLLKSAGFPTNTLPVLPSCVERRPTQLPIQLHLSINYSFSIGNQIFLLCFENFLSTWSVKILISAKDTLVLLSLLTVTAIFYNCREGNTCVQTLITNV